MTFVSAYKAARSVRGVRMGKTGSDSGVVLATDKQKSKDGVWRYSVRINISSDLYERARFLEGDRLDVLFSQELHMAKIVRVEEGGWAASFRPNSSKRILKFALFDGMPTVARSSVCEIVSIETNAITVKLPSGASFEKNLREEAESEEPPVFHLAR